MSRTRATRCGYAISAFSIAMIVISLLRMHQYAEASIRFATQSFEGV
jgi:hypothetical protein